MQKQLHTFIMGAFTLFAIYLYYVSAKPITPKLTIKEAPTLNIKYEETNALNYLNKLRQGAGLIPFTSNAQLNTASRNHADYLTHHLTYGHREDAKYKDFTGEFASSRVSYAGYATPQVIEDVSTSNPNAKESINGLFAAIYHRLAFLDFRADAIGIGISQNPNKKTHTAFVYDMSSNALEQLYKKKSNITQKNLNKALNINKQRNKAFVIYPFDGQTQVPPAFFDELPDPLPEYKVSGFPISIFFNSFYHKEGKLLKFELYDNQGVQVKNSLILNHKTDPNRRLEKLDFVLFPLERLKWNTQYHVKFSAMIDHKLVNKEWYFKTQTFKMPLHIVKDNNTVFTMKASTAHVFYFPPSSKVDLLHNIAYPANIDIEFIDKNTIKLTALSQLKAKQKLHIGKHQLTLNIQK